MFSGSTGSERLFVRKDVCNSRNSMQQSTKGCPASKNSLSDKEDDDKAKKATSVSLLKQSHQEGCTTKHLLDWTSGNRFLEENERRTGC